MIQDEIWKAVIRKEKIIPGYDVSNKGRIFSRKTGKFLSITNRVSVGRGNASLINLIVPRNWNDYSYSESRVGCQVHQLVAEAFMPIDKNPPDELKDTWDEIITPDMVGQKRIPKSWKKWVADTVVIDHIDNNPFNNNVENLRYTTPDKNNVYKKSKFYGENNP